MPQVHRSLIPRVAACLLFAVLALLPTVNAYSQTSPSGAASLTDSFTQLSTITLWDGKAPGAVGNDAEDIPFLTVFPPQMPSTGTAVIVAPGGAYIGLASNHEGRQVADWFASRGVTAFLLHYRLGTKYLYPVPLQDAQRAIRLVRSRAAEFGIQPDHIGMMGFSAGGHLAAMAGTLFEAGKPDAADPIERQSSRPDFMILTYPWLNAMDPTVKGSIEYYCGVLKLPAERCRGFKEQYSPELHVTAQTPPTFIFHTAEDSVVPVETSLSFFSALLKAHVPAEMHIFEKGPHGVGLALNMAPLNVWPTALEGWLRLHGLLTPKPMPARK